MTKITVTIDTKSNTQLFLEMLNALKFVKNIESHEEYDDTPDKEELQLLEDRWTDYLTHPQKVETWDKVKSALSKKYAR